MEERIRAAFHISVRWRPDFRELKKKRVFPARDLSGRSVYACTRTYVFASPSPMRRQSLVPRQRTEASSQLERLLQMTQRRRDLRKRSPMTAGAPSHQRSPGVPRRKDDGQDHAGNAELQSLKHELRLAGLSLTRPRLLLARLLKGGNLHFVTPERLHSEASSAGANMTLQTCYNTLEILADRGLIRRVFFGRPKQFYDTNPIHAAHIYDENTGELHDLPGEWLSVARGLLGDIGADRINLVVWISRSPPA